LPPRGAWSRLCPGPSGWAPSWSPLFRRHARAVERRAAPVDPVGQAQAVEDLVVDPVPHARLVPVTQAPPAGHAGSAPHLLGQVLPGDAGAEDEENTSKDLSVRDSGPPTLGLRGLGRQERFDDRPQLVGYKSFFHTDLYPNEPVLLGTLSQRRAPPRVQQIPTPAVWQGGWSRSRRTAPRRYRR